MEWLRMTAAEYREQFGGAKKNGRVQKDSNTNKYNAKRVEINGVVFDSKKESRDAVKLQRLASTGVISNLQYQVKFVLQEGYKNNQGKSIRPICYVADFVYERDNQKYVQDSKGVRTEVYKIKRKLFEKRYPEYIFIES